MRIVTLAKGETEATEADDGVLLTGTDEDTGELVTFKLVAAKPVDRRFVNTLLELTKNQTVAVPLADFQVVEVASNPEWDSPGTSPEG